MLSIRKGVNVKYWIVKTRDDRFLNVLLGGKTKKEAINVFNKHNTMCKYDMSVNVWKEQNSYRLVKIEL